MNYNVIVVLAGGIDENGILRESSSRRVQKAKELYDQKLATHIVMSGKQTLFRVDSPKVTEAEAMVQYAIKIGIPKNVLAAELESTTTLSNIFYVSKLFLRPNNWKKIIVVTSDYHLRRVKYVCGKFLGPEFQMRFEKVGSNLSFLKGMQRFFKEYIQLALTKRYFYGVKDGDFRRLSVIFDDPHTFEINPVYSILNMITKNRKKNAFQQFLYQFCLKHL